ncbi:hypothetical protein [Luteitalea sp.]|uniref:hypothetical protein n=1 Tax=Luteitalea sp. TaxID=2004800 RepID=UPI0025BFE80E|nr:hypothetical protein [Luteitalea sp.]
MGLLAERRVGRVRLFINAENLTDVRTDPLELAVAARQRARRPVDAWASLDGRGLDELLSGEPCFSAGAAGENTETTAGLPTVSCDTVPRFDEFEARAELLRQRVLRVPLDRQAVALLWTIRAERRDDGPTARLERVQQMLNQHVSLLCPPPLTSGASRRPR